MNFVMLCFFFLFVFFRTFVEERRTDGDSTDLKNVYKRERYFTNVIKTA